MRKTHTRYEYKVSKARLKVETKVAKVHAWLVNHLGINSAIFRGKVCLLWQLKASFKSFGSAIEEIGTCLTLLF